MAQIQNTIQYFYVNHIQSLSFSPGPSILSVKQQKTWPFLSNLLRHLRPADGAKHLRMKISWNLGETLSHRLLVKMIASIFNWS